MTQNEKLFVTALILATEGKDRAEEAFHWHLNTATTPTSARRPTAA